MTYIITEAAVADGKVFRRLGFYTIPNKWLDEILLNYGTGGRKARDWLYFPNTIVEDGKLCDLIVRWDEVKPHVAGTAPANNACRTLRHTWCTTTVFAARATRAGSPETG